MHAAACARLPTVVLEGCHGRIVNTPLWASAPYAHARKVSVHPVSVRPHRARAGFILPYLAGIHYMLWSMGIIDTSTPVAGASSGSLIAGFSCANVSEATYKQGFASMSAFCRAHHNCQGILDAQLRQTLRGFLPPLAFKTCASCCDSDGSMPACMHCVASASRSCDTAAACTRSCTNVGSLSITTGGFPPKRGRTGSLQIGQFSSNEDLLSAALASCYIPLWSGE